MLKLKTTSQFTVPIERGTMQSIVRIAIYDVNIGTNNIIVEGHYYRLDEDSNAVILSKINKTITKEQFILMEELLPELESSTGLIDNIDQRIREVAFLMLQMEERTNFGTAASDFVIDTE